MSSTTADAAPGPASGRAPAATYGEDGSPTDDESAATEQAILDAGAAAIRRFGIRRTSMKEVARLAGVSRGSVYRYFPDKDALIAAVLSRNDAHFMAACNQAVDGLTTLGDKLATMAVWIRDQATGQLFMNLDGPITRLAADDCHLPYNVPEEQAIIPSPEQVIAAARKLARF